MKDHKVETCLKKSLLVFLTIVIFLSVYTYHTRTYIRQVAAASTIDYYVAPGGSDSNDGSQSHPFATIQKAADTAHAGITVHVLPGNYTSPVENNNSGTASSPITFISDTQWAAKIVTSGGLRVFPFRNNGNYVHIIGFDITSSTSWIGILTYGQYNVIQGDHVHDLKGMACNGSPGGTGIGDDSTASNNIFINNVVNNIGSYPDRCDYIHGIYPDGSGDIMDNNITFNNAGNGIYSNHGIGNMTISGNTTFANGEYGIGINGTNGADNFIVTDNIIVGNGIAGMKTWATVTGTHNQFLNNLFYSNPVNYINNGNGTLQNTLTADPQFVNYQSNGTGDYHLKAISPAIDAGTAIGAPETDFDGNARPQGNGYDIGAYEYLVAPTPTPTPTDTATPTITPTPTSIPTVLVDGPANSFIQTSSTKSFSWSHTVGTNSNALLMVQVVTNSSSNTVSSVETNGLTLTKLSAVNCGTSCRDEVWYQLNPVSGTNTITVTTSTSAAVTATAISFYNVSQSHPFGALATTSGQATASLVSPSTDTTQLVADFYGNQATPSFTPTAASGQTQQVNVGNSIAQEAAISIKPGNASSTSMGWIWSTTNGYADVAVGINSSFT